MLIDQLARRLARCNALKGALVRYRDGEDCTLGVPQSARALVVASAFDLDPRPTLVVVSGEDAAVRFANNLAAYLGRDRVLSFPERPDYPWRDTAPDSALIGRRCRAIHALASGDEVVIVASARSLLRCVPPRETDAFSPLHLEIGAQVDFSGIAPRLVRAGYERLGTMDGPGTFSLHGDTLDVYPAGSTYPIRAEFFGDDLDGLRRTIPATGQSIGDLESVDIYPCREVALSSRAVARAVAGLSKKAADDPHLASELEMLQQGIPFGELEMLLPWLYNRTDTPIAHIAEGTLVVLCEPRALFDDAARSFDEVKAAAHTAGCKLDGLYVAPAALDFGTQQRMSLLSLHRAGSATDGELAVKRPELIGTDERLMGGLTSFIASGYTVVFAVGDRETRQKMRYTLSDAHIPFVIRLDYATEDEKATTDDLADGMVNLVDTDIPSGFIIPEAGLAIVSLSDASSRVAHRTARREVDPTSLTFPYKPGDYVVHAMHGVALFSDIVRQEVAGVERDYLLLSYANDDKLFVPVEQADKVTRYIGPEGTSPRLTRLNTSDWARAVGKARRSAKKLAFDLVDLYARRSTVTGFRYSPDTPWQKEMEESFPYTETPDQLAAIADVKADMESDRPMDRLVCGDVGFGKTEVVLRAAFKAVEDRRQVMVLCPTTILAQQHYTTFSERFEPFDVSVEVLSRFRTAKQQREALEGFAAGDVDVLIGTHRLLSRDVNPKDLGLIIIDEEQRFGVQHKEQLKNLREQVDVLTLSATPIPRTMQMALSGVRDMSLIETPPPERTPVKVHVGEWDSDVVSAAIRAEMQRGGQTYYVSNRVQTIDDALARVLEAVPEARVGVAHGQMDEHSLEEVMESFSAGEYDVLISTTIIESGIDNPHTNTLIIEDSQRLGLAQLYQLKGRVGRSYDQAYAYFLFPSHSSLTPTAVDRLDAIAEFDDLASGTKIAMRDLEIRGAGNMFGGEQSGNISSVGFDLFASMLAEAVSLARGEAEIAYPEVRVDLPGDFYLPEEYVRDADERVLIYRKLAGVVYAETVDAIAKDVASRHGAPPAPAGNLFGRSRIKALAGMLGVTNVAVTGSKLVIEPIEPDAKMSAELARRGCVLVSKRKRVTCAVPRGTDAMELACDLLETLAGDTLEPGYEVSDDEEN